MATATQLMPSQPSPTHPGINKSAFSPFTDSPSSPAPFTQSYRYSNRSSGTDKSDSLHPPASPYPAHIEPSPVDSTGTNSTEIEDDEQEQEELLNDDDDELDFKSPIIDSELTSPASAVSDGSRGLLRLDTAARPRADSEEAPASVIHAPAGFKQFSPPNRNSVASPAPTDLSESTIVTPATPLHSTIADDRRVSVDTSVPQAPERPTPRAQTRQEAERDVKRTSLASTGGLYIDIPETEDLGRNEDGEDDNIPTMREVLREIKDNHMEVEALQTALSECWTLCNTLAGLSSNHRERMFNFSGKGEAQEQAWRTCWKLCQRLYESRNEDHASQVKPTLELCRDFCQALFEVRLRGDEVADSVLRVSFELNNHLYNTHDRNLPEAFRERTLDFYLTLCHRLMKQRTSLPQETDALMRACWGLAEMLFSLRQNNRDGKPADEELLGSAVQACWELCDLFREGWTQVRPDRGTPRPSVTTFPSSISESSNSAHSSRSGTYGTPRSVPETPTTIYDDRDEMSPDEPIPNILVLGPESGNTQTYTRWSSNSSNLSTYSEASQRSSSTATAGREDAHLVRLKTLLIRAAMNVGYARNSVQTLHQFVKAMPTNSFGTAPWQTKLVSHYRKLVLSDPTLRNINSVPPKRVTAEEVAITMQRMGREPRYSWVRDLFTMVFKFPPDEAQSREPTSITA
ncbi:hypothetical protein EJ05DRAFT_528127 [Pseudovirgaria hyperparasitica]|uniref:DUF7624 domain-containing protein n=1 Tax=Pseudovirgaria hyperparasitica TaxID=470096 RepID=A0A6A6WCE7_9PEZI|nr:uncharacterized protein EJ05DRAFT_528127 [Pseudovirgaria hyperparasitica]KAF2758781.1 hypothetical protein EJ05DRAFT_528127 [Pseudovirgaria hyperparasitica]